MQKPHVPQILISSAAIVGISIVWYDFNVKVFQTIFDLIKGTFCDTAVEKAIKRKRARRIKEIEEEKEEEKRRIGEEEEEEVKEEEEKEEEEAAGKTD